VNDNDTQSFIVAYDKKTGNVSCSSWLMIRGGR